MKATRAILSNALLALFMAFIAVGCSVNRMNVSKLYETTVPVIEFSENDISISSIKAALDKGSYDRARQMLDQIQVNDKNRFEYHLCRGFICKHQNRLNTAMEEFTAALDLLNTSSADLLYCLAYGSIANTYYDLNDYKSAAIYHRKCREHGGDNSLDYIAFLESFEDKPYAIQPGCSETSVKMKYKFGWPYIKVIINNGTETELLVDTGANGNLLSAGLARKFNIRRLPQKGGVSMLTGVYGVSVGVIDSLQIGDVTIKNIPVMIADSFLLRTKFFINNLFAPHMRQKGIIGLSVLRNFNVTFDYNHKNMELHVPINQVEPEEYNGNIFFKDNLIHFPVQVNNKSTVNLLMDTGAWLSYIPVSPQAFNNLDDSGVKTSWGIKACPLLGLIPMICPEKKITKAAIGLGDYQLSNAVIRKKKKRYPPAIDGLIGNRFFEQFKTSIDFVNMRIELEPYE